MSGELYLGAVERANDLALRRRRHFSDLCERYERRRDHLIEFGEIAPIVADMMSGLTYDAVRRKFLLSVKLGAFGRRGPRQTIERLIDLTAQAAEPGCYSLRPSYITVEMNPKAMRACRSTWAQWIGAQGWPVPAELSTSALIEGAVSAEDNAPPPVALPGEIVSSAGALVATEAAVLPHRPWSEKEARGILTGLKVAGRPRPTEAAVEKLLLAEFDRAPRATRRSIIGEIWGPVNRGRRKSAKFVQKKAATD